MFGSSAPASMLDHFAINLLANLQTKLNCTDVHKYDSSAERLSCEYWILHIVNCSSSCESNHTTIAPLEAKNQAKIENGA